MTTVEHSKEAGDNKDTRSLSQSQDVEPDDKKGTVVLHEDVDDINEVEDADEYTGGNSGDESTPSSEQQQQEEEDQTPKHIYVKVLFPHGYPFDFKVVSLDANTTVAMGK